MKTRYLTVFLTAAGAMFALSACDGGSSTLDPNVEARLRNDLPAVCTAEQISGLPGGGGDPLPRRSGAGDRLFVRLLRALHLPAALFVGQPAHLSDDARADLSGADEALDRHRDRGLLSRLSLRAGRHD